MFKFVAVFALLACVAAQRHGHGHGQSHGFAAHAPSHATTDDVHAEIIVAKSDVRPDGYEYLLETTKRLSTRQCFFARTTNPRSYLEISSLH
ncbi:hypothetical protein DOY81_004631 [Sarcophaga bullata]|nr:hypothetical protein DOY81_004631 [Sarcophaga bullata]